MPSCVRKKFFMPLELALTRTRPKTKKVKKSSTRKPCSKDPKEMILNFGKKMKRQIAMNFKRFINAFQVSNFN